MYEHEQVPHFVVASVPEQQPGQPSRLDVLRSRGLVPMMPMASNGSGVGCPTCLRELPAHDGEQDNTGGATKLSMGLAAIGVVLAWIALKD